MQFYSYENKHCKTLKRDLLMAKSILMNCCMGCSVHTLAEWWAASQKSCDKISQYLMSWSHHCYSTRIDYYQAWTTETAVKNIASLFWMLFAHWATTTMLPPLHVDLSFPRYWGQMPPPLNCNDAVPICHWPVSLCCFRPCCLFHAWLVWLFLLFCPRRLIAAILVPVCCCCSCHYLDLLPLCRHQLIGVAIFIAILDVADGATSCRFCFCPHRLIVAIAAFVAR